MPGWTRMTSDSPGDKKLYYLAKILERAEKSRCCYGDGTTTTTTTVIP